MRFHIADNPVTPRRVINRLRDDENELVGDAAELVARANQYWRSPLTY